MGSGRSGALPFEIGTQKMTLTGCFNETRVGISRDPAAETELACRAAGQMGPIRPQHDGDFNLICQARMGNVRIIPSSKKPGDLDSAYSVRLMLPHAAAEAF